MQFFCGQLIFWRGSTSLPPDPAFCSTCYGIDDDDSASGAQLATVQPAFGGNRRGSKKPAAAQSSTIKKKPATTPNLAIKKKPATLLNLLRIGGGQRGA